MVTPTLKVRTTVKITDRTKRLKKKIAAGSFKSLGQAAGVHRKIARNLVKEEQGPSPPGQPVRSPTGLLRKSIIYSVDRSRANYVLGTAASVIDDLGELHEFGGSRGRDDYAPRPFVTTSLDKIKPRLNRFWAGCVNN